MQLLYKLGDHLLGREEGGATCNSFTSWAIIYWAGAGAGGRRGPQAGRSSIGPGPGAVGGRGPSGAGGRRGPGAVGGRGPRGRGAAGNVSASSTYDYSYSGTASGSTDEGWYSDAWNSTEQGGGSGTSSYSDPLTLGSDGTWTGQVSSDSVSTQDYAYTYDDSGASAEGSGPTAYGGSWGANSTDDEVFTTVSNQANDWTPATTISGSGQASSFSYTWSNTGAVSAQTTNNTSWSPANNGAAYTVTTSTTNTGDPPQGGNSGPTHVSYTVGSNQSPIFEETDPGAKVLVTAGGIDFPTNANSVLATSLAPEPTVPTVPSLPGFGTPTLPVATSIMSAPATTSSLMSFAPPPAGVGAVWGTGFEAQVAGAAPSGGLVYAADAAPQTLFAAGNTAGAAGTLETMVGAGGVFGWNNVAVVVPVTRSEVLVNYGFYGVSAGNPAEGGGVSGDDDDEGESDDASAGLGGDSADFASLGSQSQGGIAPVTSAIQRIR